MVSRPAKGLPLLTLLVIILPFNSAFAHNFTANESASFLSVVDRIRLEAGLVASNLGDEEGGGTSVALGHAMKASDLLTLDIVSEISEKNERVADELDNSLQDLQANISISSDVGTNSSITLLVEQINSILDEAIDVRVDKSQQENVSILALSIINDIDAILTNYGDAFALNFDMTDMSLITNDTTIGPSETSNITLANVTTPLIQIEDYQSAVALSEKVIELLNERLVPNIEPDAKANITKIEAAMNQLEKAIKNQSSPMEIMKIVHSQIHPNFQSSFNLS